MKFARAILILPKGPYRLRQRAVQGPQEVREDPTCIADVEESLAEPKVVVLHWQTTYAFWLNAAGQASLHICSSTYVLYRACAMCKCPTFNCVGFLSVMNPMISSRNCKAR